MLKWRWNATETTSSGCQLTFIGPNFFSVYKEGISAVAIACTAATVWPTSVGLSATGQVDARRRITASRELPVKDAYRALIEQLAAAGNQPRG